MNKRMNSVTGYIVAAGATCYCFCGCFQGLKNHHMNKNADHMY